MDIAEGSHERIAVPVGNGGVEVAAVEAGRSNRGKQKWIYSAFQKRSAGVVQK